MNDEFMNEFIFIYLLIIIHLYIDLFNFIGSLVPLLFIVDEVAEETEGSFGLIGGDHVTGTVDEGEPEVSGVFDPAGVLAVDCPDLFFCSFPLRGALPVEAV